jgi:UDP-N-acetylmuramoyl-tripeptide--D-alanyl-D-alanine ligase
MSVWTGAHVTAALGMGCDAAEDAIAYERVVTDTRTLQRGDLFVALVGEKHDAHAYLRQAAEAGARGAVVQSIPAGAPEALRYYVVPDTLSALGRLARFRRRRIGARVCAITGTNGKTTTKELLRAVLATRYRTHATAGNFNNLVGAPLTLLSAPSDVDVTIAEVGTNAPGEIALLAGMVEPDAAIITGIAAGHLEGLGDLEGVLREKTSLLTWLPEGAPAVVADDPPSLAARARALLGGSVAVAGITERADGSLHGTDVAVDDEGRVRFTWEGRPVRLRLRGRHNARNALLALAIGRAWDVPAEDAIAGLEALEAPKMRAEVHRYGELTVIADCYNANPGSVAAAIDLLASMPKRGGRVAVLGSMLELGPESEQLHRESASDIAARDIDIIVATGAFAPAFEGVGELAGADVIVAEDALAAWEPLRARLRGNEVVLLKGSRGVALERLLPRFEEVWGVLRPHGETSGSRDASTGAGADDAAASTEHARTSTSAGGGRNAPEG